ncbi:MAG: type II toxin-antitoxin system HicA family toxin [Thiobacillus sp.]|nr:type II toxin-antitoxin system HicA family toxin [Thiobacillus sp.]
MVRTLSPRPTICPASTSRSETPYIAISTKGNPPPSSACTSHARKSSPHENSARFVRRGTGQTSCPLGYATTRQTGSHIRLTSTAHGEHHITLPNHDPLKIGTLAAILASIAAHHGLTRDELLRKLFG